MNVLIRRICTGESFPIAVGKDVDKLKAYVKKVSRGDFTWGKNGPWYTSDEHGGWSYHITEIREIE